MQLVANRIRRDFIGLNQKEREGAIMTVIGTVQEDLMIGMDIYMCMHVYIYVYVYVYTYIHIFIYTL
jgi:hypothetical protein